jgi:TolB-like protein/Tfp pilus assembly protein PilF
MVLVFTNNPEAPVECALEISKALQSHPKLNVRMGIHSGPVNPFADVNDQSNLAGAGINVAQRVMYCGDAGHILLSKHFAEDLEQYAHWKPYLYDLGECGVKHGVRVSVVNLYGDQFGNPALPEKFDIVQKRRRRVRLAIGATALLALAFIVAGIAIFSRYRARSALAAPKDSVAVLPFENLSASPENAFFADGIQDDLVTTLAKIRGLKVIARSSVMSYRNSVERNLREIGEALGVAHVLEGSVRRAADRVLINVNLIETRNHREVWAEHYDRTLADSLTLQVELATEIAAALRTKLSSEEMSRVEVKLTNSPEAYVLYLRGREYQTRPTSLQEDYEKAERLYTQAVQLDPSFALAHARLSATLSYIFLNFQPTAAIRMRARTEAEESLRLQPDLGEGHLARALCLYWTERAYDNALRELKIAGDLLPNDADIPFFTVGILRRQGRWNAALASMERALSRDPRNALFMSELANTECMLRHWSAAARAEGNAAALAPDLPTLPIEKSYIDFWLRGDLAPLRAVLAGIPSGVDPDGFVTRTRWDAALLARDFVAAEHAVVISSTHKILVLGHSLPKSYMLGCVALANGETERAQPLFEAARPTMEGAVLAAPSEPFGHAWLGVLYAYLGRKEDALREGREAVTLLPESRDAVYGPSLAGMLALIYARTGESDQALTIIERLLTTPGAVAKAFEGNITLAELRLRWEWDPLRNNPRFQKIVAGQEPKTIFQ